MLSTRWEEVKGVFEAALLQEERERDAFVSNRCGGDLYLAQEVHRLLAADRDSSDFLESALFPGASLLAASAEDRLLVDGDVLCGRFKVLSYLGEGGMGQVYRVVDLELRQEIAIKVIRPEIAYIPGVLSHFRREVNATRKVTHPNVCRTFDLETHSPSEEERDRFATPITFLTMELLVGETVAERIRQAGPLPPDQLRTLAEQVARALQAAHSAGVIHCDLKPSNIFVTGQESDPRFVVTDFGIAKFTNPQDALSLTTISRMPGATEGTPFYMAPEQIEDGTCSIASDIYAYGLVLYEALTGQRLSLYQRSGSGIRTALVKAPAAGSETPQTVDPLWVSVIARCIRSNPVDRFVSAQEILDLLARGPIEILAPVLAAGALVEHASNGKRGKGAQWHALSWSVRTLVLSAAIFVPALLIWVGRDITHAHSAPATFSSSVAVMPIHDKEQDQRLDALANEITVNLTNDLAQMSGIRVPSQSTVGSLGDAPSMQSIRRTLDVDNVVNGNIVKVGGDSALQIELVDARTGFQLWGQSFTRKQMENSSVDDDIALDIAYQLRMRNEKPSTRNLGRQHSSVPAAEQAFLQGKNALAEHTYPAFERAAKLFQQAVDADPAYAAAMAELAHCYMLMVVNNGRPEPSLALMGQAEDAARSALRMDSTQVEAYGSLAEIQVLRDQNWGEAEENFKRAEELDADYVPGHVSYALHLLIPQSRFAEARVQFTYADREAPKTLRTSLAEASAAYFSRRYEDSLKQVEAVKNRFHTTAGAIELEALDYLALKSPDKALKLLVESPPDPSAPRALRDALYGIALAQVGKRDEALAELKRLEQLKETNFNSSYNVAALCAELGQKSKALSYLEKSHQDRDTSMLFLAVDPLMDPLRSDSRFKSLLSQLNLL
jgi:serine/threonine protein kinase